ncbi:Eukaryotic initiation factor 4E [Plasmodiophora brassicae]|uniref:Uncharacterized protein n=1 Tax=Plasmodiophora brassicae TaxID=37360 RepID=A0A0G4J0U6_PLABS|nr:hypothetical protein PBRA_008253 [Plasmodiophora brassicae]SPR00962.1 unnamed protein product [Plasmodiophora brassicae]
MASADVTPPASDAAAPGSSSAVDPAPVHLLLSKWTLWFDSPQGGRQSYTNVDWGAKMKEVLSFESVEDFWRLFNNIKPPSAIATNANYHLFRHGVQPAWEDPMNANGGRWKIELKNPQEFDSLWRLITAAIVGEAFDCSDHVCGVIASPRKNVLRISVWMKDAADEAAVVTVGKALKDAIKYANAMDFEEHNKKSSSKKITV